jgi:hypothetical protein
MITVKASQEIFTYAEVANLTGVCAEHLENLAKRHRLGFIARATETQGNQTDQWCFRPRDLMVLSDVVPALCALKSRPPCLIGGSLSLRTN